jgi:uncharacterized RDD family membrane protein YckC
MDNNQTAEEILRDHEIEIEKEPTYMNEKSLDHTQRLRYAGFWMRFWAYLLDLIVIGSIDRILVKPIFRLLNIPLVESDLFAPISIATAITFYAYFVLMTRYFQQTLGKMVFGLRVVGLVEERLSWKTILFREWIGRFISTTIVIGYIITAFLPKKQGLHDLFSDTSVVHEY